jgi:hypothetical protein
VTYVHIQEGDTQFIVDRQRESEARLATKERRIELSTIVITDGVVIKNRFGQSSRGRMLRAVKGVQ